MFGIKTATYRSSSLIKYFLVMIYICCWAFPHKTFAQPPGYLGKRWVFVLDNNIAPSVFDKKSLMNWQTGVHLGYVISRNYAVGLGSYLYATSSELPEPNPGYDRSVIAGWSFNTTLTHFNLFKKGNIAPIGPYQRIILSYWNYSFKDKFAPYQYSNNNQNLSLGVGIGSQRVIYRFITVNYGLQANFFLPFYLEKSVHLGTNEGNIIAYKRMNRFIRLNANIGLGFLLF